MRAVLLKTLAALVLCTALAHAARAQQTSDPEVLVLAQVLQDAAFIARGHPIASQINGGDQYVRFEITEILKGTGGPGRDIEVRHPAPTDASDSYSSADGLGGDVILVLGARDAADGSYSAAEAFSSGEYTIESDPDGDWVLVNSFGVDAGSVAPKDVHRKTDNERIPLDLFRRLARRAYLAAPPSSATSGPQRAQTTQVPAFVPPQSSNPSGTTALAVSAAPVGGGSRRHVWIGIAVALAAIASAAWILLKASTSRSR